MYHRNQISNALSNTEPNEYSKTTTAITNNCLLLKIILNISFKDTFFSFSSLGSFLSFTNKNTNNCETMNNKAAIIA